MVDILSQIEYWRQNAIEDFEVARQLVESEKIRHGLFFAHLAIEKILKAHVCKVSGKFAPRIHNLIRLSELGKIKLSEPDFDLLAEMNAFNIEGRYPIPFISPVSKREAEEYLEKCGKVLKWLMQQL
jgi:HEPN domain-containing protein